MLVVLVDVPFVSADTVRALVDAWRRSHAPVVRPVCGDRHGHPVIFDRAVFDELRHADPALGAKAVVRAHGAAVLDVPVDDAGAFLDVDTPEDYARATGQALPGGG
jgi:molybdenum cofactor cytidylyltransferase